MKDTKSFKAYMATLITVAVIGALYLLIYIPMQAASRDAVLILLGALTARLSDVYAFYFGSSESSQRKTELLGGSANGPATTP